MKYIKAGHFPQHGRQGAGLFCTKTGKWKIPFGGQDLITERIDKAKRRVSKQGDYYQVNTLVSHFDRTWHHILIALGITF